jgi:hypothetical protein
MAKIMTFNYYTDPGHGWVKVSRKLLIKLGIENKISGYSYQRGESVYLEEDSDMSLLMNAFQLHGKELELNRYHTNRSSKIRSYQSFKPTVVGTMTVKNLMTGENVEIPADTPWCCNPASETYWSM